VFTVFSLREKIIKNNTLLPHNPHTRTFLRLHGREYHDALSFTEVALRLAAERP